MEFISSYEDFRKKSVETEKSFLLLYKPESDQCKCAFQNLEQAGKEEHAVRVYAADVSQVRDIHSRFGITSVPALLVFGNGDFENAIKGCQDSTYYSALMESAFFQAKAKAEGKIAKRVTVYSTPSCSWCTTLKSWLRKNHVQFSDVDISRDERAAQDLVNRSGQQGVPQTDINGQIVVGFDQVKLKELLEIQ
jgi:glutaredoxin-like YruB-family protein